MAKSTRNLSSEDTPVKTRKPKSPRRPQRFVFELVDDEGHIEQTGLVLTHRESAKLVLAYLKVLAEREKWSERPQFTQSFVSQ